MADRRRKMKERGRGRKSRPFSRLGIGEEVYIFVGFVLDFFV